MSESESSYSMSSNFEENEEEELMGAIGGQYLPSRMKKLVHSDDEPVIDLDRPGDEDGILATGSLSRDKGGLFERMVSNIN